MIRKSCQPPHLSRAMQPMMVYKKPFISFSHQFCLSGLIGSALNLPICVLQPLFLCKIFVVKMFQNTPLRYCRFLMTWPRLQVLFIVTTNTLRLDKNSLLMVHYCGHIAPLSKAVFLKFRFETGGRASTNHKPEICYLPSQRYIVVRDRLWSNQNAEWRHWKMLFPCTNYTSCYAV